MSRACGLIKQLIHTIIIPFICSVAITLVYFAGACLYGRLDRRRHPQVYRDVVTLYANRFQVPADVVYGVMYTESHLNPDAVSHCGARGLMQLMPATYQKYASILGLSTDENLINAPCNNICVGVYYLSELYRRYGVWETAYAAYNAGEDRVDRWLSDARYSSDGVTLSDIPFRETKDYVRKVIYYRETYIRLYGEND